jgi:hypothetical protein
MAIMQKYSKQQPKSGNESTLKKLIYNQFRLFVFCNRLKPLLWLLFRGIEKTRRAKKNEN